MKYSLLQSMKNDRWTIIALFIGFSIVYLLDIPLTFLTAFITILLAYIIGDLLKITVGKPKNNSIKK